MPAYVMDRALLAILAAMSLTACSQASPPVSSTIHSQAESTRVVTYHTLGEVVRDSDVIVVGTATAEHSVQLNAGIPFTIIRVNVVATLKGVAGSTIQVRLVGLPDGTGNPLMLQASKRYLLCLRQFEFLPGKPTGQYVVVGGGAGSFVQQNSVFVRIDRESSELPLSVTTADIQRASS